MEKMIFYIFGLLMGVYITYLGFKFVFFTKRVSKGLEEKGMGKLEIRNWRLGKTKLSFYDIRFTGIIMLFIGLLTTYFLLFGKPVKNEGNIKSNNSISGKVDRLISPGRFIIDSEFIEIKKDGIQVMPYLIKVIDEDKKGYFGNGNPYESDHRLNYAYVGVRAAYMIEFILYDTNINKRYRKGVIVKRNTTDVIPEYFFLTHEDMKNIKKIYSDWWVNNKNSSLPEIQIKYDKRGILENSNYCWK